MPASDWMDLLGLFFFCLLAATIVPISSEIVFVGFLNYSPHPVWLIFVIASCGNTLGGVINYYIGYTGMQLWRKKKGHDPSIIKYRPWVERYGSITAILSWVPIIGDPLLVVLGFFRTSFWKVFFWMVAGKWGRYALMVWLIK